MKILILANDGLIIYNLKKELLVKFIADGNEVIISVANGEKVPLLAQLGCKIIVTEIDRRGMNPITDLKLYKKYKGIVKAEKPNMILTYTVKCNIYGGMAAKKYNIPYYANITGLGTSFQRGLVKKLVVFLYRKAMKKVEKVFFENVVNLQVFLDNKITTKDKAILLSGAGVNLEEFEFCELENKSKTEFLFIGRIMKEKGIDELLEVAKRCCNDKENMKFSIIGFFEDDYKAIIDDLSKQGVICYYGFQNDVKPYIQNCQCVVLPSYHEGMSNTLLESAAMGRPLITSNIPGCLEAVNDGVSGYLVNKKDSEDLYAKIKMFAGLPFEMKEQMGFKSRKLMEEKFDRKRVIEETLKAIKKNT